MNDGGHSLYVFLKVDLRHLIRILERFSFMTQQTKLLIAVLEYPARCFTLAVVQMAGGAPQERVLMLFEIIHNRLMAITADKDRRMICDILYFFFRT